MNVLLVFALGLVCGVWKNGIFTMMKIQNDLKNPALVEKSLTPATFAMKHDIKSIDDDDVAKPENKTENK